MADFIDLVVAGEPLRLYAERAAYWPRRHRLFVADIHLGKDDAFRAAGIALPRGGAVDDLRRLAGLVHQSGATSLWILGDLLHGGGPDTSWRTPWEQFLAEKAGLEVVLIDGNHDRMAARAGLGIPHGGDYVEDGPFEFAHMPHEAQASRPLFRICGHVHPVVRVEALRRRFPAFAMMQRQLILPAFSVFTGGWLIERALARYGCVASHILNLGPTPDTRL